MLDTNAVIALLKAHPALIANLRQQEPRDVVLSALVLHELYYGAYRSVRVDDNLGVIDDLQLQILDFTPDDARRAGQIRADLARAGTPIGPYDVLIAGQALERELTLITHNTREFSRVAGLRLADWEI